MQKRIRENINRDGIDRRGFLECMAWAGTGVVWTIAGGIATSKAFGEPGHTPKGDITFVQISERLRSVLGIAEIQYVARKHTLAAIDSSLEDGGR